MAQPTQGAFTAGNLKICYPAGSSDFKHPATVSLPTGSHFLTYGTVDPSNTLMMAGMYTYDPNGVNPPGAGFQLGATTPPQTYDWAFTSATVLTAGSYVLTVNASGVGIAQIYITIQYT